MNLFRKKLAAVLTAAAIGVTALPVNAFAQTSLVQDSVTVEYNATVAKPSYSIKGTPGKRKIKLSCSTKGATIYYTTDGSKPTTDDKKYTGLITIKKDTKIRAIAVKDGSKSAIMTKTVKVKTLLGDATGDGKVNENDYARFKNYRAGKTSYICKDNCDMDGSGGLSKKDLQLLRDYLDEDNEDGETSEEDTGIFVEKPEIVVYKAYGGKRYKITCDTKDAVIYYTTNGTEPDKNDKKYTETFIVDSDTTVKAVAYKNGSYSKVKTRSVTVDKCKDPYADKDTETEYKDSVKVTLKCDTDDARICYTTDGSDPVKDGRIYNEPIELTEDTTLKIYAECKGFANSKVITYKYKVKSSNYTISGKVWEDSSINPSDGKKQNMEQGINCIKVLMINASTNSYEEQTTTATIGGVAGSYELKKAKPGNKYKVVFQFNGQKYRAFKNVVKDGNQAVCSAFPEITIKNAGAFSNASTLLVAVNSYNAAVTHNFFNETYAVTSTIYDKETKNVDLALLTNVYGDTKLSFVTSTVTSAEDGKTNAMVANQKVYTGDTLSYTLRVTNNSKTQDLKSATLRLYLDPAVSIQGIKLTNGASASYSYQGMSKSFGMAVYQITCPDVKAGKNYDFIVTAKVNPDVKEGKAITTLAEIVAYTYVDSCYDRNSIPGNFTGTIKEQDEAASLRVYAYESLTDSQSIAWASGNDFNSAIYVGSSKILRFNIENGTSTADYTVHVTDKSIVSVDTYCTPTANGTECVLVVTGKKAGTTNIMVMLTKDASKLIQTSVTVENLPAA